MEDFLKSVVRLCWIIHTILSLGNPIRTWTLNSVVESQNGEVQRGISFGLLYYMYIILYYITLVCGGSPSLWDSSTNLNCFVFTVIYTIFCTSAQITCNAWHFQSVPAKQPNVPIIICLIFLVNLILFAVLYFIKKC